MSALRRVSLAALCLSVTWYLPATGQTSALLGDRYTVALENLPDSVGVVVDPHFQRERPAEGSVTPLAVTFDGIAEDFPNWNVRISERQFDWPGGDDPGVPTFGLPLQHGPIRSRDWMNPGEILEFTISTLDGGHISQLDDLGPSFLSVRGLEWTQDPSASPAEFYPDGWYIYFSSGDRPFQGYQHLRNPPPGSQLRAIIDNHPFDEDVEEVAFLRFAGREDSFHEPIPGGVNLYFGTTQYYAADDSWEQLANVLGVSTFHDMGGMGDATAVTLGVLVQPPLAPGLNGDCSGDGSVDAQDLACVTDIETRDIVLAAIPTLPGDLNGNGDVTFPDFLTLTANFGSDSPRYTDGNIDLTDGVAFADFLILAAHFGATAKPPAAALPEPAAVWLLAFACGPLLALRRRPCGGARGAAR